MPRRRKAARAFRKEGALSDAQRQELFFGFVMFPNSGAEFENRAEAAVAWRVHRCDLMREINQPGRRPAGFYLYDLKMETFPNCWFDELEALDSRGLLPRDEQLLLEQERRVLDPAQSADFMAPSTVERISYGVPRPRESELHGLREYQREAACISGWHQRRGRPGLVEKYEARAAAFQRLIAEIDSGSRRG